jgi:hypothetical protein
VDTPGQSAQAGHRRDRRLRRLYATRLPASGMYGLRRCILLLAGSHLKRLIDHNEQTQNLRGSLHLRRKA